jgi:hypothetical protein
VMRLSITGCNSCAFGSVVLICSLWIKATGILANIALR